jgi:segregation and condensation protein B
MNEAEVDDAADTIGDDPTESVDASAAAETGNDAADALDDDELEAALEAVLLVIDAPAATAALASAVGEPAARVEQMLRRMSGALTARRSGIDLRPAAEGWRFYTRNEYAPYVERLLLDGARSKLTRAALETLAVVAYRQPLTRARVSAVRGVNVDGVMRTLIARGLIAEAGNDPDTNATTYATTELFLERLGLSSLADLPPVAPLLPDVDVIDDISEDMESDPRFAKLRRAQPDAQPVVDTGVDDDN